MVPYSKILWTFADKTDKFLIIVGFISSVLCGLGLPSFVFLFGDIADSFTGQMPADAILNAISKVSRTLTLIGIGIWVGSYIFFAFFVIASERIGQKMKVRYLEAILTQEIAWFDTINV